MRLQHLLADGHPLLRPGDVVLLFDLVVVLVVFVADVERRVREDQVGKRLAHLAEDLYAITTDYPVTQLLHSEIIHGKNKISKWKMQNG